MNALNNMISFKYPNYFNIIPVKDKVPQIPWREFTEREQTNEEKIKARELFPNGSIGIITGKVSNILVLDDDGGLDLEKYKIPKTWSVKTPRGGTHYYFRWGEMFNEKVTTKVGILPKVDVRGNGGYVVFYGFERPYYTIPLANPPQWLIDLLPDKNSTSLVNNDINNTKEPKSKLQELLDDIKPGNRNDSFTRIAGSLRSRGYSSTDIFGILSPKAREVGFRDDELQIVCNSVSRYEPKIINSQIANNNSLSANGESIEEFLKDQEKVEWLVPGLIAKKSICFVAGLPETGKTWMLIDLAIECAKGDGLWLGKFPITKAKVLFIDQERFKGETQRRFRTVINAKDFSLSKLKDQLLIRCGTSTRLDLQNSYEAFYKEISEIKPELIIIDSFATFHTKEENNRKDIQEVLERIKQIRSEFGCTFIFIHHENKNAFNNEENKEPSISQMAGSIAISAAAETALTVRKHDSDSSMVYHTKSTLSSTISPFLVKITDENEEKTKIKVQAY